MKTTFNICVEGTEQWSDHALVAFHILLHFWLIHLRLNHWCNWVSSWYQQQQVI